MLRGDRVVNEPADGPLGPRAGSRFGHYLLRRLLGSGGFGDVYEAEDTVMDRLVALKLITAPYSRNEVFRERLFREARHAGRLHDPHVVPIHHCGEIDGQLYIDMRLVEGTDLQDVLANEGPLSPPRAVAIVRQVAAALDAAHNAQMVHRDVKPANILLTADDFACLVDFGLANAANDASLTSSGTTMGTFAYMAPERLSHAEVSHSTDIYALACVLYECLTGCPPYATGDLPALITAHLTAPIPRPCQRRPHIPEGFDEVIARGMAKKPADRYASARELAVAAQRALTASGRNLADTIPASTPTVDRPLPSQEVLPFTALINPSGVAVDLAGDVYVADFSNVRVLRLPAGSNTQVELPFTGLTGPASLTVDIDRHVYLTDYSNRVLKLPAGSTEPVDLPFTGLVLPLGVAIDAAGNVYIADATNNRVLQLAANSDTPTELPFTGLRFPNAVAVDVAGDVYVTDSTNNRVLKLITASNTQVELPFTGLNNPYGVAADIAGNVYVADNLNARVLKLPAGSSSQVELPFTGLKGPVGVALDHACSVYVTDFIDNRVLKLPAE
ncbi:protein kinase [Mycobacterium shimoidei]|nr:protein kinase [Mycobacterium shimoidei]ODR14544.1 hypothetical protein BHQ16_06340 [Mycobacterium shimoidei]